MDDQVGHRPHPLGVREPGLAPTFLKCTLPKLLIGTRTSTRVALHRAIPRDSALRQLQGAPTCPGTTIKALCGG
jgi:hypothetical protein